MQKIIPLGANGALRLTTARYYNRRGADPGQGIEPDVVVAIDRRRNCPGNATKIGESSLKGHLPSVGATSGKEESGSLTYVPPDPKNDKQLNYALDLIRGLQVNAAFPPDPSKGVPN